MNLEHFKNVSLSGLLQTIGTKSVKSIPSSLGTAAVTSILNNLKTLAAQLLVKTNGYDALNTALSSCSSLFDYAYDVAKIATSNSRDFAVTPLTSLDDLTYKYSGDIDAERLNNVLKCTHNLFSNENLTGYCVRIKEDEFSAIVAALDSCRQSIGKTTQQGSTLKTVMNVSTINGFECGLDTCPVLSPTISYSITEERRLGVRQRLQHSFKVYSSQLFINQEARLPFIWSDTVTEEVGGLAPVSTTYYYIAVKAYSKATFPAVNLPTIKAQSIFTVLKSTITAAEINTFAISNIQSLATGRVKQWFASVRSTIQEKADCVKKMMRNCEDAYVRGGFKGLVMYWAQFFSSVSFTDKDGTLTLTDNSKLVPREYIGGLIATTLTLLGNVASVALGLISPVVSAIAATVGSVLYGVFASFNADVASTHASILDDEEEDVSIPYSPEAHFQVEITIPGTDAEDWYTNLRSIGYDFGLIPVDGGCIIYGPGAFDAKGEPLTVKAEFHALVTSYDFASKIGIVSPFQYIRKKLPDASYTSEIGYCVLFDFWRKDCNSSLTTFNAKLDKFLEQFPVVNLANSQRGYLEESDERNLFLNVSLNIFRFFVALMAINSTWFFGNQPVYIDGLHYKMLNGALALLASSREDVDVPEGGGTSDYLTVSRLKYAWTDLFCDKDWKWYSLYGQTWDTGAPIGTVPKAVVDRDVIGHYPTTRNFAGVIETLPGSIRYAYNMPRYNARTFWAWIALAALATTVVTSVAVYGTVKWKKFAKRKIAENTQKFMNAQAAYNEAVSGERQVVKDGQTVIEKISDDEKQQAWKAYKKQAFKNNLWQHLIGGSRYDVTTFYGDAAVEDEEDSEAESETFANVDEANTTADDSTSYAAIVAILGQENMTEEKLTKIFGSREMVRPLAPHENQES